MYIYIYIYTYKYISPRVTPPHTRTARAQPPAAHRRRDNKPTAWEYRGGGIQY